MFAGFAFINLESPWIIIILLVALVIFDGKKLTSFSKNAGKSIRDVKKGINEAKNLKDELKDQAIEARSNIMEIEGESKAVGEKKADKSVS